MSCPIKRGVMLAGGICSGKSTIVDFLRREYSIGVVSFGDFVKRECAVRGLTATREALQVLGYELFQSLGPKLLVDSAIQYATLPNTPVVLFDGVRDVSVVREIRVRCEKSVCLFLEADLAVRYARFTSRASSVPMLSFSEFRKVNDQPIERGIESIRAEADLIVNTVVPVQVMCKFVSEALASLGFVNAH